MQFKKVFFLLLVLSISSFAQTNSKKELRDSTFTLYSTAQKVYKKYPDAKLVLPELPDGVNKIDGIVYISYGERKLHLNLYYPEAKDKFYPGIILIHGGGWRSGDMTMEIPMAQKLAAKGYVTTVVEYRLSPEAKYPAAIYDLKTAIKWMRKNSSKYNIDTNKIAIYGCSAGGELAAFLGTTGSLKKFESDSYPGYSTQIQAIIDVDGLLDFTHPLTTQFDTTPEKAEPKWLGGHFKDIPEVWKEASPITYVSESTPPFLFINSSIEHYHAGRDEMIVQLKKHNIYYEVFSIPDTPHTFWLFHPWFETTFSYIYKFLNKTLKER